MIIQIFGIQTHYKKRHRQTMAVENITHLWCLVLAKKNSCFADQKDI